jgi:ribosomal protein L10
MAPGTKLVRTLNAVPQQVALVLNAYAKKQGEEGGE